MGKSSTELSMGHGFNSHVTNYQRVYISLDISMIYPYDIPGIPWIIHYRSSILCFKKDPDFPGEI
jgi:hypothetical protein